jgi:hypothetical protein
VSRFVVVVVAAAVGLAAAHPAAAQEETRRRGSVQLFGQTYRPNVDADLPGDPYNDVFGGGRGWQFRALFSWSLYKGFGALEAGLGSGYFQDRGEGQLVDGGGDSTDPTAFRMIPVSLSLTYRFDWLERRYRVPLMLYGRASLERFNWWVSDSGNERSESGATNGYSFTGGAGFLLDFFDRGGAHALDRETGINDTWLTFDVTKSVVDDFGASDSWDLSDEELSLGIGLLFAF